MTFQVTPSDTVGAASDSTRYPSGLAEQLLASERSVHEGEQAAAGLEAGYRDGALGKPAYTAALDRKSVV